MCEKADNQKQKRKKEYEGLFPNKLDDFYLPVMIELLIFENYKLKIEK